MPWKVNLPLGVWPGISGGWGRRKCRQGAAPRPRPRPRGSAPYVHHCDHLTATLCFNTSLLYTLSRNHVLDKNYHLKFVAQSNWNCFWSISVKEVEGPKDLLSLHIFFFFILNSDTLLSFPWLLDLLNYRSVPSLSKSPVFATKHLPKGEQGQPHMMRDNALWVALSPTLRLAPNLHYTSG